MVTFLCSKKWTWTSYDIIKRKILNNFLPFSCEKSILRVNKIRRNTLVYSNTPGEYKFEPYLQDFREKTKHILNPYFYPRCYSMKWWKNFRFFVHLAGHLSHVTYCPKLSSIRVNKGQAKCADLFLKCNKKCNPCDILISFLLLSIWDAIPMTSQVSSRILHTPFLTGWDFFALQPSAEPKKRIKTREWRVRDVLI